MSLSQSAINKVDGLATKIIELVTTHAETTGSSEEKGHVQAGGAPQTIGENLSAGTDNGFYARADHVHTVYTDYIQNTHAYTNLEIEENSSQEDINSAIDTKIGEAITYINK